MIHSNKGIPYVELKELIEEVTSSGKTLYLRKNPAGYSINIYNTIYFYPHRTTDPEDIKKRDLIVASSKYVRTSSDGMSYSEFELNPEYKGE